MKKISILAFFICIPSFASAGLIFDTETSGNSGVGLLLETQTTDVILGQEVTVKLRTEWVCLNISSAIIKIEWPKNSLLKDPVINRETLIVTPFASESVTKSGYLINNLDSCPIPPLLNLSLAEFTFEARELGDIKIQLTDSSDMFSYGHLTIHSTPEPATLILLAAGGLFIRNRSRIT